MDFAFNPDDGPARIIRRLPASTFRGEPNAIAYLFREQNVLLVNSEAFDSLSKPQKSTVLRTKKPGYFLAVEISSAYAA